MPRETSRRLMLAGLAASPAVLAPATLPHVSATRRPAAAASDAALIARAGLLVRLERLHSQAHVRWRRREEAVADLMPRKPERPAEVNPWVATHHVVDPGSDLEQSFEMVCRKPLPEEIKARQQHAQAMAAWEAQGARLSIAHGVDAAEALVDRLWSKLEDARADLEGLPATTPAGLAAKAEAVLALDSFGGWGPALVRSLAADVLALGGRADA